MKKVLDISEKKFEKFHFDEKGEILYLKRNKLNKMNFDYFKEIYGLNDFDYNHSSKEQRFKNQRLRQMIYYLYSKLHQGEFEEEFSFKTLNDICFSKIDQGSFEPDAYIEDFFVINEDEICILQYKNDNFFDKSERNIHLDIKNNNELVFNDIYLKNESGEILQDFKENELIYIDFLLGNDKIISTKNLCLNLGRSGIKLKNVPLSYSTLFKIYCSTVNELLFEHHLVVFNLKVSSDNFDFLVNDKSLFENLKEDIFFDKSNIYFVASLDGDISFGNLIFKELYFYNEKYMLGKTFNDEFYSFRIDTKCTKKLDVSDIIPTYNHLMYLFNKKIKNLSNNYISSRIFIESINFDGIMYKNVLIAIKDEKYGLFDLEDNKWVIEPKYNFIYFNDEYAICSTESTKIIYFIEDHNIVYEKACLYDKYCDMEYIVSKVVGEYVFITNLENQGQTFIKKFDNSNVVINSNIFPCKSFGNRYVLVKFYDSTYEFTNNYDIIDLQNKNFILFETYIDDNYNLFINYLTIRNTFFYKGSNDYICINTGDLLNPKLMIIKIQNENITICSIDNVFQYYLSKNYCVLNLAEDIYTICDVEELVSYIIHNYDSKSYISFNKKNMVYEIKNIPDNLIKHKFKKII